MGFFATARLVPATLGALLATGPGHYVDGVDDGGAFRAVAAKAEIGVVVVARWLGLFLLVPLDDGVDGDEEGDELAAAGESAHAQELKGGEAAPAATPHQVRPQSRELGVADLGAEAVDVRQQFAGDQGRRATGCRAGEYFIRLLVYFTINKCNANEKKRRVCGVRCNFTGYFPETTCHNVNFVSGKKGYPCIKTAYACVLRYIFCFEIFFKYDFQKKIKNYM